VTFRKKLFKNILILGGYNYFSQIIIFLSSIVLSRLLLPEEYGFVALISVFTGFVTIFSDAGLSFAIIRSDYGLTYQKALNNLSFYIGVSLFIIMMILSFPIAYFYDDLSLIIPTVVMSTIFIFTAITIVPSAILNKNLEFNYLGKSRFLSSIFSIVLMIIMAYFGFSYWALIIPNVLLQAMQYVFFEYKVRIGFKFYKLSYPIIGYRKTKSLIKNLGSYNIVNYWARNADNLIIGKVYSSYDLGIYNRGYKMLQLTLGLISGLFGTILYPSLKKLKSEGGNVNYEFNNILGIISLLNFPVGAVLILFPELFVRILWGENWLLVAELLPYFGILIIFQTLIGPSGHIFILMEKERMFMKIGVISAIILVLCIIIGAFYSVKLIAISYTIGYMSIIVPVFLFFGFYKTIGFDLKLILKFWLPKLIMAYLIIIFLVLDIDGWLFGLIILYGLHLIYFQRNDIRKLKNLVLIKLIGTNS
jgi:O-antigen/teichoic acid export membrane protein